ncbi:Ig-like domain-containing protein, partial [Pseudomonas helleri]
PSFTPSSALSNNLEAIEFTVSLKDLFGNYGADRAIEWGTNLGQFHRHTTRTNASGKSTANLRSDAAGSSTVIAQYNKASPLVFDPVTFTSTPYFEYVRFDNPAVIGVEVELSCRVVELNGDPVSEPQTIAWSADTGTLLVTSSKTDINGIAKSRFKSNATGTVIITASAGGAI